MLRLDDETRLRILAHCREELPNEACGLLIGRERQVRAVARARNVAPGDRRRTFEVAPSDFVAADSRARDRGFEILGSYHSHPDRGAEPSEADRAAAQEGWLQLIVGRPAGDPVELRCWLLAQGRWAEELIAPPRSAAKPSALPHAASFSPERSERAARLRGYFDLQLRFAERVALVRPAPLSEIALTHTNFHRRFGFGVAEKTGVAPAWGAYASALAACRSHRERLELTVESYARGLAGAPPKEESLFGCFSYTPPDEQGRVRLHFMNRDSADGVGPLARSKLSRRRGELRSLLRSLTERHPAARTFRGSSWLYHREAYRRLFPPCYTACTEVIEEGLRFSGSSSWGQFLTHDGVNESLRAQFLASLPGLDPGAPWRNFPFPALRASGSVSAFKEEFGVV